MREEEEVYYTREWCILANDINGRMNVVEVCLNVDESTQCYERLLSVSENVVRYAYAEMLVRETILDKEIGMNEVIDVVYRMKRAKHRVRMEYRPSSLNLLQWSSWS